MKPKRGIVYLLGAGPGDPELVTLRVVRRLRECDLVLYDALVHPEILRHCRADATLSFVGKRAGNPSERQASINRQMVEAARSGLVVGRLKGGDPFLFGRGSEEGEVLAAAGIRFEVVPGVPSSLAAGAYAGISLTHRHLASSIAYLTATESESKDRESHDWAKLATATQSLVIFMGRRRLAQLMDLLMLHGRAGDTPAAIVQSASLPSQRVVVGTVADLADKAAAAGIGMPALTLVGPVMTLRDRLRWYDSKPLFGKRVLVTRPVAQASELTQRLRDEGAEAVEVPTIRIVPPQDPRPLITAVQRLAAYDWVVFTSSNGVDAFFAEVRRQSKDARLLGGVRVAAIGPKTAATLCRYGVQADLVPDEYRGEAVAEAMLAYPGFEVRGAQILLPRAAVARDVLPEQLRAAGADVEVVEAYQSLPPSEEDRQHLRGLFERRGVDVVTFTSSSTVRHLWEAIGDAALLRGVIVASIGPVTSATAAELGIRVDVTATDYTVEGLVEAIDSYYSHVDAEDRVNATP